MLAAWAFTFAACTHDEAAPPLHHPTPTHAEPAAAPPVAPTPAAAAALPRAVGDVTLRMGRQDVESRLGVLSCHQNSEGFHVCRAADPQRGERGLEVFLYRDEVISLAYEAAPPREVWSYLEALTGRYGKPSLNGMTERDRNGRLHEVYGWRDARSLYSVRFIWQESPPEARRLSGTAIALWDREAYAAWEKETKQRTAHPPATPDLT